MAIDNVGMEITSWLCIFVSLPFAGLGFISYQGMNFERIMITALRSLLLTKQNLIFMPRNAYYELLKDKIKYYREESLNKNDKKLRKAKKTEQI